VEVFQDEEYRSMFGKFQEERDQSFQGPLPLSLGRKAQRWICCFRYGE
jgi:hypothetical protein